MKYVNLIFAVMMLLFAAVQYNDPDAPVWITIYLVPAVWTGLAALRPEALRATVPFALLGLSVLAAIALSVYYWPATPGFWRSEVWMETETAREGMGMMLATLAVGLAFVTVGVRVLDRGLRR